MNILIKFIIIQRNFRFMHDAHRIIRSMNTSTFHILCNSSEIL